jgi:hypothetical protein
MRIAIAWVALLVGCGDSPSVGPDAGEPDGGGGMDAGPDAPGDTLACTPTGGSGDVIVDGPSGAATLELVFLAHDAAGAVIDRSAVMGSDASATLAVPSCGMVTIFERDPAAESSTRATTWANVQPGDRLVHPGRRPALAERDVQVELATLAGATRYQITMACSIFSTSIAFDPMPGTVSMTPRCPADAQSVTVLATATTPAGTSAALVASAPLAATGTTVVTPPAYAPVQGVVASVRGAGAFAGGTAALGALAVVAERVVLVGFATSAVGGPEATVGPVPVLAGRGVLQVEVIGPSGQTPRRGIRLLRGLAAAEAAIDVDLAGDGPPTATGTVDAATTRPTVTWGVDRPLTADVASISLDQDAGESGTIRWRMFAPARPGTVRFPELPPDLLPAATPRLTSLGLIDASELSSYDEARTRVRELFVQPPAPGAQLWTSESRY